MYVCFLGCRRSLVSITLGKNAATSPTKSYWFDFAQSVAASNENKMYAMNLRE